MDTPTTETVAPKPTSQTMAFKVMLATWLGNAAVIYLATKGFFIPDEIKAGLAGVISEGLNTFLPILTTVIAGWVTKIVAQISADKTVAKAKAQADVQTLAGHAELGRAMENRGSNAVGS